MLIKKLMPLYNAISRYTERANRTLQEEFLNTHLDLPAYDTEQFNSKLMENLISHNTKRVHKGLGNLSPIDFELKYYPESQMYATRTNA